MAVLEEVIYVLEIGGGVPVGAHFATRDEEAVVGYLETVPADRVEVTGAVPKGVSRSELRVEGGGTRWRCRVVVDV